MKKLILGLLGTTMLLGLTACGTFTWDQLIKGEGELVEKQIDTVDFTALSVKRMRYSSTGRPGFVVNIHKGDEKKVTLTTQENISENINFTVKGDYLEIESALGKKFRTDNITIDVTGYSLKEVGMVNAATCNIDDEVLTGDVVLKTSGACKYVLNNINANSLDISASGASKVVANSVTVTGSTKLSFSGASDVDIQTLECNELNYQISGASLVDIDSIKVNGDTAKLNFTGASNFKTNKIEANDLKCEFTGASKGVIKEIAANNIKLNSSGASSTKFETGTIAYLDTQVSGAGELTALAEVESLKAEISGASKITARVNKEIRANISGASTLNYYGNALIVSQNVSGGSTVKRLGD